MAYYGKGKRMYRKRPYKRKYRNKAKNKQVVSIVKRELHRNIENKQVSKAVIGARVSSAMPTAIGTGMFSIIPNTTQGTTGQSNRIGRQIKPISLRLSVNAFTNNLNDEPSTPIYFDVYVFSFKKFKDQSLFDTIGTADLAQFLRPTGQALSTDTFYAGAYQNFHQNVNRDVINLYAKKRFLMSPIATGTTTPNQDPRWIENYSSRQFTMNIPLSKHLPSTLKYTNGIDETPNNCGMYCCVVATETTATLQGPSPTRTYGAFNCISTMVYEDA